MIKKKRIFKLIVYLLAQSFLLSNIGWTAETVVIRDCLAPALIISGGNMELSIKRLISLQETSSRLQELRENSSLLTDDEVVMFYTNFTQRKGKIIYLSWRQKL